jgi:hypothetical protein
MNLKRSSHYKEGLPQYVKVHQIFLSGGPVVHQGKKVSVKPWSSQIFVARLSTLMDMIYKD